MVDSIEIPPPPILCSRKPLKVGKYYGPRTIITDTRCNHITKPFKVIRVSNHDEYLVFLRSCGWDHGDLEIYPVLPYYYEIHID